MNVQELINRLMKINDKTLEIKICSYHRDSEPLFYFNELRGNNTNVVACSLDNLIDVWQTEDKSSSNKEIYLLDRGAYGNTTANYGNQKIIKNLNKKCANLDARRAFVNVSKTITHPHRKNFIDQKVSKVIKIDNYHADDWDIFVYESVDGQLFFNLIHTVIKGIGICDRAIFPTIGSLENFVEVLEKLQNGE